MDTSRIDVLDVIPPVIMPSPPGPAMELARRARAAQQSMHRIGSPFKAAAAVVGVTAPSGLISFAAGKMAKAALPQWIDSHQVGLHVGLGTRALVGGLLEHGGLWHANLPRSMRWIFSQPTHGVGEGGGLLRGISASTKILNTGFAALALGTGVLDAFAAVEQLGPSALVTTMRGRGGVLQAIGGGLSLSQNPVARLASASVFGVALANELGAFGRDGFSSVRTGHG